MITGYDNSLEVAGRIVDNFNVEWEYVSDRKQTVAAIALALQQSYEAGVNENNHD